MNINERKIKIRDSLATYLGGPEEIENFTLSLLDVARFSGHLCPSVAGAFMVVETAVKELFPDQVCERGLLQVEMPGSLTDGANGPISNVIGYITGAWSDSGFAGIGGEYRRKNLLTFETEDLLPGQFRFTRSDNKTSVVITYTPQKAVWTTPVPKEFAPMWQQKVKDILSSPEVIQALRR